MSFQPQVRKRNRERIICGDFVLFINEVYLNSGAQFFWIIRLEGFLESTKDVSIRTLTVSEHSCDHSS